jgi:hypothetical protein
MACRACKREHERHEDSACGCGCGAEPMGCAECLRDGGSSTGKTKVDYESLAHETDMDDPDYGEGW